MRICSRDSLKLLMKKKCTLQLIKNAHIILQQITQTPAESPNQQTKASTKTNENFHDESQVLSTSSKIEFEEEKENDNDNHQEELSRKTSDDRGDKKTNDGFQSEESKPNNIENIHFPDSDIFH